MVKNAGRLARGKEFLAGFPVECEQFVFQVARLIDPPPELLGSHLRRRLGEVAQGQLVKSPYAGVISRFFHTFQLFVNSYKVRKKDEKNKYISVENKGTERILHPRIPSNVALGLPSATLGRMKGEGGCIFVSY